VDLLGREVVLAVIGNQSAIRRQDAVDLGHYGTAVSTGCGLRDYVIECAVQSERLGKCALVHPEDAEATAIWKALARAGFENILRRQPNTGDVQPLTRAMNCRVDSITRIEAVGRGECLSDNHFVVATGFGKPTGSQENEIKLLGTVLRDRKDHSVSRFFQPRQVENDRTGHASLDSSDSRNLGQT